MKRTSVKTAPASPFRRGKRHLSDALETTDVAMNHFDLSPGDTVSSSLHAHYDQEEVYYVESGTVTFWTGDEEVDVHAGEVIRFAPGEFHHGYNASDGRSVLLAIGAPGARHDIEAIESRIVCSTCEERTIHRLAYVDDDLVAVCDECGTENETPKGDDPPSRESP